MGKCWREVLEKGVGEKCCKRRVVEKCARGVLARSVGEECCREVS